MDLKAYLAKRAEELEKSHSFHKAMAAHHAEVATAHTTHCAACKAAADALDDGHEMKAHLHKTAAHHEAMAGHHDAMSKAHHAQAEHHKAETDAMKAVVTDLNKTASGAAPAVVVSTEKGTSMKAEDIKKCAVAMGLSEEDFKKQFPTVVEAPAAAAVIPGSSAAAAVIASANALPLEQRLNGVTDLLVQKATEAVNSDPKVAEMIQQIVLMRVGEALGKKIVPDSISSVIPSDVPTFGIRAIPRPGGPAPSIDKAAVPPQFRHLITTDDEV